MTSFRLEMHEANSERCAVLKVVGELGLVDVEELETALVEVATGKEGVAIDLEGCQFIDSMGLAALVRTNSRFAEKGQRFAIFGPTEQVRRVLEVSGLDRSEFVFESLDEALA
jgi:anti-sigma B factor antagonist